jgi:hypothetical protein
MNFLKTFENSSDKDLSSMKWYEIKDYFNNLRKWKSVFYSWGVDFNARDDYDKLTEFEDFYIRTNEVNEELNYILEDINDISKSGYEIDYNIFCIKPFGEYNYLEDILIQHQTKIKTYPRNYAAQFMISILKISTEIDGTYSYRKLDHKKLKTICKITDTIYERYGNINCLSYDNDKDIVIYFTINN